MEDDGDVDDSGRHGLVEPVSAVPNAGLGARQTFTAQFTDALGAGDIAFAYVKLATGAIGASNSCMVRYDGASRMGVVTRTTWT